MNDAYLGFLMINGDGVIGVMFFSSASSAGENWYGLIRTFFLKNWGFEFRTWKNIESAVNHYFWERDHGN